MFTWRLRILALGTVLLAESVVHAQVVTDGTTGDAVTVTGPDYDIGADLGTQAGSNLFHSFDQFSIDTGESATFSGPGDVDNVIGRVTGGDISSIDGRLASTIEGADLWLLNPAGVVFGPDASLDVSGSFHVSTADELRMEDGGKFSASNPSASGFSMAAPEAFGFLGANPAGITVAGSQLSVADGETLSLVGGDVDIAGASLVVDAGRLNVLAADGPAEADVAAGELTGAANGDISVRSGSVLASVGDGGGAIRIEGGAFVVDEASSIVSTNTGASDGDVGIDVDVETADITGGSQIVTGVEGGGRGGAIDLDADVLRIADDSTISSVTVGAGDGGDIDFAGGAIEIRNNGLVFSFATADGDGGAISVKAVDLTLSGGDIASSTSDTASGAGGDLFIGADSITMGLGGQGSGSIIGTGTFGLGDAGDVEIRAGQLIADGGNQPLGATIQSQSANPGSSGGQIRFDIGNLVLSRGATVFANPSGSSAGSASIDIVADTIRIDGAGSELTGILINVDAFGGAPGAISIHASDLDLQNGAQISTLVASDVDASDILIVVDRLTLGGQGTAFPTQISTDAVVGSSGDAGRVAILADVVDLNDGARISSSTQGSGNAGVIDITARSRLDMRDNSTINSNATNTGDAGAILIKTPDLAVLDGAIIAAITDGVGAGGAIQIDADSILLDNRNLTGFGGVTTQGSAESSGDAGDIDIKSDRLVILNQAEVSSAAFGDGDAGSIRVEARDVEINNGDDSADFFTGIISFVSNSGTGNGGDIDIKADSLSLRGAVTTVAADNRGAGVAGAIDLELAENLILDGGIIDTASANAGGGRITISAGESITVADQGRISTTVFNDAGDAGNIIIDAPLLALGESEVLANADAGTGGDIRITADDLVLSPDAVIDAEAGVAGVDGTIAVSAPEADLSGDLAALDDQFLDISSLLRERCAARRASESSSFTLGAGGTLPPDLDAPRLSLLEVASNDQRQQTLLVLPCPTPAS